MAKVTLVKLRDQNGQYALYPYDKEAQKIVRKYSNAELVIVDLKKGRNPHFHRKAFAILHMLHDMVDTPYHFEPFRRMLTIKAGYFTTVGKVSIGGETQVAVFPESLAFENMNENEFQQTISAIIDAFIAKFGPEMTQQELEQAAFAL